MRARVVEAVAPSRLGSPFRRLLGAVWLANLGDGITLAAGPLLLASLTQDAFVVALGALLQWLAPLLFALWAGALIDRLDRRRIMLAGAAFRVVVLVSLVVVIAGGRVAVPFVLVALFLMGITEVFTDNSAFVVVPTLVDRDDLPLANARLMAGYATLNQLAGPPIGAALFGLGALVPFAGEALLLLAACLLLTRLVLPARDTGRPDTAVRRDVVDGLRWAWHHPAVRALTTTIFIFNITFGAAWSVLVLYSAQRLGLGEVGYGLLITMSAIGGVVGTLAYARITRYVPLGQLMRIGLVIETLTHLALALTTSPVVAYVILLVFGTHAFVWSTTSLTIRQRVVPNELLGRVSSVNTVWTYAGLVAGSAIGGVLAQHLGVVAPFWFAFAGSAIFVVAIWRSLRHLDERPA